MSNLEQYQLLRYLFGSLSEGLIINPFSNDNFIFCLEVVQLRYNLNWVILEFIVCYGNINRTNRKKYQFRLIQSDYPKYTSSFYAGSNNLLDVVIYILFKEEKKEIWVVKVKNRFQYFLVELLWNGRMSRWRRQKVPTRKLYGIG